MVNTVWIAIYIIGFLALIVIVLGLIVWWLWNRRKLVFTNFLNESGQWEKKSWKPYKLGKTFDYDNQTYKFDSTKCTRDNINRPIAHYYKGNPEQQQFDVSLGHKALKIGTAEITTKDFRVLMLSKVLKDIFSDDELMNWIFILLVVCVGGFAIVSILTMTHNPSCALQDNNATINIIAKGVQQAILKR